MSRRMSCAITVDAVRARALRRRPNEGITSSKEISMTTTPDPTAPSEEAPHVLVVRIDTDGWPSVRVECPHDSIDRPCGTWIQKATGDSCTCDCDACLAGNHDGCDSDYVADVGRQHCQCEPINQCWFDHAAMEVGLEVFRLPKDGVTFRVAAHMSGHGWDDPIDVDPMPS